MVQGWTGECTLYPLPLSPLHPPALGPFHLFTHSPFAPSSPSTLSKDSLKCVYGQPWTHPWTILGTSMDNLGHIHGQTICPPDLVPSNTCALLSLCHFTLVPSHFPPLCPLALTPFYPCTPPILASFHASSNPCDLLPLHFLALLPPCPCTIPPLHPCALSPSHCFTWCDSDESLTRFLDSHQV